MFLGFAVVEALALLGIAFGFVFATDPAAISNRAGRFPCCSSPLRENTPEPDLADLAGGSSSASSPSASCATC